MKNKIYYGEYTLRHWIKLMLNENIVLPEYQRHFVWQERDVKRLIMSLKEGQFVQPVTIALYDCDITKGNLIIDGQQRLTSVLLASIGYFPDKSKFASMSHAQVANEDDSAFDDGVQQTTAMLWKFTEVLQYGRTVNSIVSKISKDAKYVELTDPLFSHLDDAFWDSTYLGFSYVVPESSTVTDVQRNFSQLFRNINYFGKRLDAMESRKSLYYQNSELTRFFEGLCQDGSDVLCGLNIIEDLQPCRIDFVRYLSILSQFHKSSRTDAKDVLVGYSAYSSRESYYADYVSFLLGIEQEDRIDKFEGFDFNTVFAHNVWQMRFPILRDAIHLLKPLMALKNGESFSAWYEADYWLFGVIYYILFEGKVLKDNLTRQSKDNKMITLKQEIEERILNDKMDSSFSKNSNRLVYLRSRLVNSCNIFSTYVH